MSISCLVCLENFGSDQDVVSIKCGHIFHDSCLQEWRNSKQELANRCPLCRVTYNKRSLKKLFLGVADSESDIKFKENLRKLETEKSQEEFEKQKYMNELNHVKMALGIKDQQYQLVNSVNNDFLQTNQKLKEQNESLQAEKNRILHEMENLKKRLQPTASTLVDLTDDVPSDDDDEIQFVSATKIQKTIEGVVEINDDDDDDVQFITDSAITQVITQSGEEDIGHRIAPIEVVTDETNEISIKSELPAVSVILEQQASIDNQESIQQQPIESEHLTFGEIPQKQEPPSIDESEPTFKKPRPSNENDILYLSDFILSQI